MLKERRETLRKLAETVGSDDQQTIAYRQQFAMEHQQHLRKELLDIQSQKRRLQAQLKVRSQRPEESSEETPAPVVSDAEIDEWIDQEPSIANLWLPSSPSRKRRLNSEMCPCSGGSSRRPAADPVAETPSATIWPRPRNCSTASERSCAPSPSGSSSSRRSPMQVAQNGGDATEQELLMLDDIEQAVESPDQVRSPREISP